MNIVQHFQVKLLILMEKKFNGANLTAVFGGVKCDLRNAIIEEDALINACSVFGGNRHRFR